MLDKLQKWVCRDVDLIFYFLILMVGPLVILHGCMPAWFLSPFLDVKRMSVSTVSFLTQLGPGITCLQNAFL